MISVGPSTFSKRRRWMVFVDGENFTFQGQKLLQEAGVKISDQQFHSLDSFLWIPNNVPKRENWLPGPFSGALSLYAERAFYYTTVTGANGLKDSVRENLWKLGFHPEVFQKTKGTKAKGVDITLTKDVLCHAFQNNYDAAVIVAGDGDYVPLVKEIKRLGKIVCVSFFKDHGLNNELRLTGDYFHDLKDSLIRAWQVHL